jgi:hypothetical protein
LFFLLSGEWFHVVRVKVAVTEDTPLPLAVMVIL